jgi:hypothetical protein
MDAFHHRPWLSTAPLNNRYPGVASCYRVKGLLPATFELTPRALHKNRLSGTGSGYSEGWAAHHSPFDLTACILLPECARYIKQRIVFQHVVTGAG